MKHILLASVSAIALTCGAQAADMPVKAPAPPMVVWSWAGPYLGIQGGVVSHRGEFDDLNGFFNGSPIAPITYKATETGGIVGGHLGYNWQSGAIVYGLEADISALWAKGSARGQPLFFNSVATFDPNWLATIRARLGVVVGSSTLLYITGGVAFGDVRNNASVTNFGPGYVMTVDKVRTGWTVGGGLEHRFAGNWTARIEGRYVDLGSSSTACAPAGNSNCTAWQYRSDFSNSLLMGLAGVSLKF